MATPYLATPTLFIVSGTSGAGKTVALQQLEDLGFYCVDNLPVSLIPSFAQSLAENDLGNAVSIDSRNRDIASGLGEVLRELREKKIQFNVLFLDAEDSSLLTRYSETRRRHPLTNKHTSLAEAITQERELLAPITAIADHHIDTTQLTPHELRNAVRDYSASTGDHALTLLFQSFGFKYGAPSDVDFLFDVRMLPNPYWQPLLREQTGLDKEVQHFLASHAESKEMYDFISSFLHRWLPELKRENRSYITVAIGCTGGQHRSVYIADELYRHFVQQVDMFTLVRHRELSL